MINFRLNDLTERKFHTLTSGIFRQIGFNRLTIERLNSRLLTLKTELSVATFGHERALNISGRQNDQ